ncbi:hypothetical protein IPM09_04300 [Candidatus Saccharibacteria bacterium]|nr:MAG: hypothetical protein IPM09_04300 [Candidatus Saccharibacteria bacterium]
MKVEVKSKSDEALKDESRPVAVPRKRFVLRRGTPRITSSLSLMGAVMLAGILTFAIVLYALNGRDTPIDPSKYQVIYLTNGQAYFGKLQNTRGEYLVVSSPYTAQTPAQQASNKDTEQTTTLLRVRDQLYGPEDTMAIKSSQVVFWQNLRDDSKISQALKAKQ